MDCFPLEYQVSKAWNGPGTDSIFPQTALHIKTAIKARLFVIQVLALHILCKILKCQAGWSIIVISFQ
jgi:hypothetical protein